MALVGVEAFKTQVTQDGSTMELVLGKRLGRFLLLPFLGVWLAGWTVGGGIALFQVFKQVASGHPGPQTAFLALWCCGWVAGEVMASYTVAMMFARERVSLTPDLLRIRNGLGQMGRTREYDLTMIRNLRVSRTDARNRQMALTTLAFDYGAKTIRFGRDLEEAEAAYVRDLLLQREPPMGEAGAATPGASSGASAPSRFDGGHRRRDS